MNFAKKLAITVAGSLLLGSGLAVASGVTTDPVDVEGNTGLHGPNASQAGHVTNSNGGSAVNHDELLPEFLYKAPSDSEARTLATDLSGGDTLTYTSRDQAYKLTGDLNGGGANALQVIKVTGGGTVKIHVTGNMDLDHTKIVFDGSTRVVFFVDGNATMKYVTFEQEGTGTGSIQLQSNGSIDIYTEKFTGVAFANQNLIFDVSQPGGSFGSDSVVMDDALLGASQEGEVRQMIMLPATEGV